jgi:uroporphyrinogen III methyltransferase/synthase
MQSAPLQTLVGIRILVTRPRNENRSFSEKLRGLGATVVELPTIEIVPPKDTTMLDQSIKHLSSYDWIAFTSSNGARFFMERMTQLGESTNTLRQVKIAAIGPATASVLERLAKKPDYMPDEFLSEKIAHGLGDVKGKRILLPRADIASRKLPTILRSNGATVEEVVAYETIVPNDLSLDQLQSILKEGVDLVTFTSPSTIRGLTHILGRVPLATLMKGAKVACIGPVTAEAARELGVHVDIVAHNHTVDGLVEAIVNEIRTV